MKVRFGNILLHLCWSHRTLLNICQSLLRRNFINSRGKIVSTGIDHGAAEFLMSQKPLNGSDATTRIEQLRGAAVLNFAMGIPGDIAVVGDWNGDGTDTIGIFRPGEGKFYLKNDNDQGF